MIVALQPAGGGVGGHRGAAVAGTVLQHVADALCAQQRQHDAGAAVLEAAGRHEPLALQQRRRAVQRAADQRRAALAHADRLIHLHGKRGVVAPNAARGGIDLSAPYARERCQQERRVIGSAPARLVQREGLAGTRVKIGGCHAGLRAPSPLRGQSRTIRPTFSSSTANRRICSRSIRPRPIAIRPIAIRPTARAPIARAPRASAPTAPAPSARDGTIFPEPAVVAKSLATVLSPSGWRSARRGDID